VPLREDVVANRAVDALESVEALDGAALKLAGAASRAVPVGAARDALSGTWLGHALHPPLTDVVIGSFLSATLLDLLGGDDTGRARGRLIAVGLIAAAPTVACGLNDWSMTVYGDRRTRPVGLAHASANLTASALYAASLAARRRGVPGRARLLSLAGGAALSLGGLLSFTRGVGVNETAFDEGLRDWTPVDAPGLEDGVPISGMTRDTHAGPAALPRTRTPRRGLPRRRPPRAHRGAPTPHRTTGPTMNHGRRD
jgi:hypothetical protein